MKNRSRRRTNLRRQFVQSDSLNTQKLRLECGFRKPFKAQFFITDLFLLLQLVSCYFSKCFFILLTKGREKHIISYEQ
jgi:hypothetical protein